jgi:hypothetical protein
MRNLLVPAINMIASALHRRTGSRMLLTDSDHMIIIMLFMREVQMPIMHVINMPLMFDGDMPTISTVRMDMFCVNDLRSETGGLPLDSTATQHTFAGVLLWLRCPMHRG